MTTTPVGAVCGAIGAVICEFASFRDANSAKSAVSSTPFGLVLDEGALRADRRSGVAQCAARLKLALFGDPNTGVRVSAVAGRQLADQLKVKPGWRLLSVNDQPVASAKEARRRDCGSRRWRAPRKDRVSLEPRRVTVALLWRAAPPFSLDEARYWIRHYSDDKPDVQLRFREVSVR